MPAPNASERKSCWDARDLLWKCMDESNDDKSACQKFRKEYEENCSGQWVKHFDRRRDYLKYKKRLETEGFTPAEGPKPSS